MKFHLLLVFIFVFVCVNSTTIQTASIKSNSNEQILTIDTIQIDEELESNKLVLNLTDLLVNKLGILKRNSQLARLESIKFDQKNVNFLNEYFSIDLKKSRPQDLDSSFISANQSSIILLKTSVKKLDREYICRLESPPGSQCSCENDCILNLNLIAYFILDSTDFDETNPDTFALKLKIPILLNDINDNRPFFYQPEILIDVDLIDLTNRLDNGLTRIPLKLATDLDSTSKNQIVSYSIERVSFSTDNFTYLKHDQVPEQKLNLYLDFAKLKHENTNKYFTERFRLIANDPDFKSTQDITLKFTIPKQDAKNQVLKKSKINDEVSSARTTQPWLNLINIVSALNELEIQYSNLTNIHEIKLKNQPIKSQIISNKSDSLITLAYLIVEKNKLIKLANLPVQQQSTANDLLKLEHDQYIDDPIIQSSINQNVNLFKINEMRNGLYSISVKSTYYDILKKSNQDSMTIDYKLKLVIKFNSLTLTKLLDLKVPRSLIDALRPPNELSTGTTQTATGTTITMEPLINSNSNLYNSVIIISTASAILVIFGLSCFTISIILYLLSKCKQNANTKKTGIIIQDNTSQMGSISEKKSETNIMVYDVLPNGQKPTIDQNMPIYSLTSSSASSCSSSSSNTNNLSPVTTTTTSILNEQLNGEPVIATNSPNGPLFDTHLHEPSHNDKGMIYEWFRQQNGSSKQDENVMSSSSSNSPLSHSSSANLIKPIDVELRMNPPPTTTTISNSLTESDSTFSNINKYRNDLYRNSQVIFKKQQIFQQQQHQQQAQTNNQSNFYSLVNGNNQMKSLTKNVIVNKNEIYQAKPITINNNTNHQNLNRSSSLASSPSYSLMNEIQLNTNINSTDNLRDSIREKMINRLSAALAVNSNSSPTSNLSSNSNNNNNSSINNNNNVNNQSTVLHLDTSSDNFGQISCV